MNKIATILLLSFIVSCSAEKKAQRQEKKVHKAVRYLLSVDKADDVCAELFPNVDSIIKGDSVVVFDTLYVEGEITTDTLIELDTVRITTTKTLPAKTIIKTVFKTDTIVRENTAKVNACEDDKRKLIDLLAAETKAKNKAQDKAERRGWIMWSLLLLILILVGWKVYKAIKPSIKT